MSDYLRAMASRAAIPANQRAIFVALCDACGEDDGTKCHASQAYLAYKSRYSVRQVRRILATLEEKHYIASAVVDYTGWGHNLSYRIFIDRVPMMPAWSIVKRALRKRGALDNDTREDLTISPDILSPDSQISPDILSPVSPDILSPVSPDISSADSKDNPIRSNSYKNSLARSAQSGILPREDGRADRAQQREFEREAMKRDPLYGAFARSLNFQPETRQMWDEWRIGLNELNRLHATAPDIYRAVDAYYSRFPQATCSVRAIVKWWPALKEGKSHDIAKLEAAQRSAAVARTDQREHAAASRRAAHAELTKLYAELGIPDPAGAQNPGDGR